MPSALRIERLQDVILSFNPNGNKTYRTELLGLFSFLKCNLGLNRTFPEKTFMGDFPYLPEMCLLVTKNKKLTDQ